MAGLEDTDQESESVSKHLDGMKAAMKAAREEDTTEVSTEAPEPEEDDDEPEAPAPAQTRREKRSGRMTARERAAAAEARAQVLQEQLERQSRQAPPERQAPITGDVDNRIRATYKEIEKIEADYAAGLQNKTMTPELERQMRDRVQELDIQRMELAAERRELQTAPQRRQQELTQQLARENSDVYGNPAAARWAYARAQQYMALGEKDSKELHDKVMAETRATVLGVRPKPDAIERQRATGLSAGPRTAPTTERKTISMPKGSPYYKMAIAAYPNLDPGAACQKWAQKVGKNLV